MYPPRLASSTLIAPEFARARMGAGLICEIRIAPDVVPAWTGPASWKASMLPEVLLATTDPLALSMLMLPECVVERIPPMTSLISVGPM